MKTKYSLFIVMVFVLVFTVACGGGAEPTTTPAEPIVEVPTEASVEEPVTAPTEVPATAAPVEAPVEEAATEVPAEAVVAPEFPLPDDASNVIIVGEGVTTFQTALSMPDVMTFYRFGLPELTERDALTEFSEDTFQLVLDGHESGKAVFIQGFPMGEGVISVSIRLRDA